MQIKNTLFVKNVFICMNNKNFIREFLRENLLKEDIFRGDNSVKKYQKLYIYAVIEFMKSKLGFDAQIIVKKKQNNRFIGDISLSHASVVNNKFIVHFNPNQSFPQMIKSLIHELTHVKQVTKGELKPAEDYKSIIWKDQFNLSVRDYKKKMKNFNEYKELPWEAEAYNNMNTLYNEFMGSSYWENLKGKDQTLDFIIQNI